MVYKKPAQYSILNWSVMETVEALTAMIVTLSAMTVLRRYSAMTKTHYSPQAFPILIIV